MRIWFNGELQETEDGVTVAEFLQVLQLPAHRVAVEVNLEVVPRGQHADRRLAPDDRVEVVSLVGGG
jgi:sulfur carrier protein